MTPAIPGSSSPRQRWMIAIGLALALTGLVTLLGSRERPWADARIMYEVAEQLGAGKGIAVRTEHPPLSQRGRGGKVYSQYALGPSLVSLPGVLLRRALDKLAPRAAPLTLVLTVHLTMAILGGLLCALFFGLSVRLGASVWSATLGAIMLGTGTMVWVYARSTYSEALQAVCALGFLAELIRITHLGETTRRRALWLGGWAGALLNAKSVFALSIGAAGVWLVIALWKQRAELKCVVLWGSVAALPLLGAALWYNAARWGGPLETGYDDTLVLLHEHPLIGLWGLFFSFGKSMFIYSPPLVLAAWVSWRFWRAHWKVGVSVGVVCVPVLALYTRFLSWSGDYCWGPRYLLYMIAPVMLAVPWWLDQVAARRWLRRGVFGSFLALGLFIQLLGSAFYWGHAVRISMAARPQWLGAANRSGSVVPGDKNRGICDSCFEDMHGHNWLPPFSPVLLHWWFLKHVPFGDKWEQARDDAPWRRHTTLKLDGAKSPWGGVRVDWWLYSLDEPERSHAGGIVVLFLLLGGLGTAGGSYLVVRGLRVRPGAPSSSAPSSSAPSAPTSSPPDAAAAG